MAASNPFIKPGRRAARWYVRFPRAAPIGIFLVILAVSLMSVFAIEKSEKERDRAQLEQTAEALGAALEAQSLTAVAYLRAGAAYVGAEDELEAQGFEEFFTEMREDARYRGVVGIGWAPRVAINDIEAFQDAVRDGGRSDFMVERPRDDADGYIVPVRFINPPTLSNRNLVGYDISSDAQISAALESAEKTGRTTASGPINLGNTPDGDARPGFMLVMPVYDSEFGYRQLTGYVFSPFEARGFLEDALESEALDGVSVELSDESGPQPELLARAGAVDMEADLEITSETLFVAAREWRLHISTPATRALSNLSLATLLFGLLASILIVAIARLLTAQATEDSEALTWLEEQNAIRDTLTRELNHRVKNTLANVLSIISLTRRRAEDIDEFAESLGGRIRALSATHDLLTQSDWGTTPVGAVIAAEIAPYRQEKGGQLRLDGPEVELAPNDALSLGLAVHELATNASKYGSLSVPDGELDVTWELVAKNLVRVHWRECGGPAVPQDEARARGFGTQLISKIVAHELRNPVDLRFEPEGVECTLTVPVRTPAEFGLRAPRTPAAPPAAEGK
ncbi:histidine kinase [Altererythrobacter halimionae]|uniref:histidine kinase n=2 Tax=Alteriqipengyuania halimionae TaxID=1926630 RepID=A0A6I4U820_9SPHN|nr:histidine kinase [Alteriqipengyuania halimionae]